MLKRIGFLAVLAACTSQDDVTQVTSTVPPAAGPGNWIRPSTAQATGRRGSSASGASASKLVWAKPAAASSSSSSLQPSSAAPVNLEAANVERAARTHLAGSAAAGAYSTRQLAELTLRDVHDTGTGAIIARFKRRIEGIDVFGQEVSVAMDRRLDALALSGEVAGDVSPVVGKAKGASLVNQFTLTPQQAVTFAIADLTGIQLDVADLGVPRATPGGYESMALGPEALAKLAAAVGTGPSRARPVLFPGARKQLLPAYYVETDVGADAEGRARVFSHVVSAGDGAVLWQRDLTSDEAYRYRVYADNSGLFMPWDGPQGTSPTPHPSAEPDGFDPAYVSPNLVSISSLEAVGVTDPWMPAGGRETIGNNVDAYLDISPPDGYTLGTDFRGQVSAPGVFDVPFDPVIDANLDTAQQTAAVTQLFYDVNWFHDWYYAAGFTEAAGNAQLSNFGRGGIEGDSVHAEAQDGSGNNNANMSTPADGASPRMQMFLWDFGTSSLTVTGSPTASGTYGTGAAAFSPKHFALSGPIVRANPIDACAPLIGNYAGTIVLIDRGGATCASGFATKATNAQLAGAAGAIVANVPTSANPDIPVNPSGTPEIPISLGLLTVNLADGDRLRAAVAAGDDLEGSLVRDATLRDGDVDNLVVAHEWGHYISNRLVHDATGLDNQMGNGLGEGWADFHALLITVRPEDTRNPTNLSWNGVYATASYAGAGQSPDPYYFGLRRYPYSTDMSKNPLTFKHLSNDAALPDGIPFALDFDHTEVHNAGEIWASMLWECYAALLRDTLGPTPRLTFAAARDRMRDYIVASYKLVPASPTLLEARDALLAAALARDTVDLGLFSQAFAKRGAGVFAVAPNRFDDTNSGIVESYVYGSALQATTASLSDDVVAVCTPDDILDNGETGLLRLTFKNVGNVPSGATTAAVTAAPAGVAFPDGPSVAIPPLPVFGTAEIALRVALADLSGITTLEFSVQVSDTGAGTPPPAAFGFLANANQVPNQSFTDDVESTHGVWAITSSSEDVPEGSRWQRVTASVTDHFYKCPSAPIAATVELQSPPLEVVPGEAFTLAFKHRFSFEADADANYDGGVIELSNDGGLTWNDVGAGVTGYGGTIFSESGNPLANRAAFVGDSADYPAFTTASLNLGSAYAGQIVALRFRVASDAAVTSPGWDIDDITITGVSAPPFDAVVPQPATCDGTVPPAEPGPIVVQ